MRVYIFEGTNGHYGFTEDPDGKNLPPQHGPWKLLKSKELNKGDKLIGVDVDQMIADIESKGYHIIKAGVSFQTQE